ncbi:hypothetical protein GS534_02980 [Rhodococcus hoagii]|nr:hypothetical protein [Prescottella equi]
MQDEQSQTCANGHALRNSAGRYSNGRCRKCQAEASRRWRLKRQAQAELIRALKARGITVTADGRLEVTDEQLLAKSIR